MTEGTVFINKVKRIVIVDNSHDEKMFHVNEHKYAQVFVSLNSEIKCVRLDDYFGNTLIALTPDTFIKKTQFVTHVDTYFNGNKSYNEATRIVIRPKLYTLATYHSQHIRDVDIAIKYATKYKDEIADIRLFDEHCNELCVMSASEFLDKVIIMNLFMISEI